MENVSFTVEEFREYAMALKDSDHPMSNLTDDVLASVVEVVVAAQKAGDYAEFEGHVVVRLADGTFGHFSEWADMSGHG